jgi:septal ring factor EnvC (AmiA/AmiB activator)
MSKKSASVKQTKVPQAVISALPAWSWGLGAVMLVALFFTYYQMVQAQQRLDQANSELADMRNAVTEAQDTREKMVKEVSSLKEDLTAAQDAREKMVKEVSSLKEDLTAAKTRLSSLEDELKDATGKLELALAESKKQKMAAQEQQKLAKQYKEEAERAAALAQSAQ